MSTDPPAYCQPYINMGALARERQNARKDACKKKRRARVLVIETARQKAVRIFGNCCFYCGCEFGSGWRRTFDHFIPKSAGGVATDNLVPACAPCNGLKNARLPNADEKARFDTAMTKKTISPPVKRVEIPNGILETNAKDRAWRPVGHTFY